MSGVTGGARRRRARRALGWVDRVELAGIATLVAPKLQLERAGATTVLGTAIGLRFMGLADDIINMAFGLLLGAVAVAAALAFGLGSREAAGRVVARLLERGPTDNDLTRGPATEHTAAPRPAPFNPQFDEGDDR